jgi:hypothetical protein
MLNVEEQLLCLEKPHTGCIHTVHHVGKGMLAGGPNLQDIWLNAQEENQDIICSWENPMALRPYEPGPPGMSTASREV